MRTRTNAEPSPVPTGTNTGTDNFLRGKRLGTGQIAAAPKRVAGVALLKSPEPMNRPSED